MSHASAFYKIIKFSKKLEIKNQPDYEKNILISVHQNPSVTAFTDLKSGLENQKISLTAPVKLEFIKSE